MNEVAELKIYTNKRWWGWEDEDDREVMTFVQNRNYLLQIEEQVVITIFVE